LMWVWKLKVVGGERQGEMWWVECKVGTRGVGRHRGQRQGEETGGRDRGRDRGETVKERGAGGGRRG